MCFSACTLRYVSCYGIPKHQEIFTGLKMEYSAKALATLLKVSVRTLHYYDEIDLVKPQTRMVNGNRIYGPEQFLTLIEIIFFKEFGFALKKIKSILNTTKSNKVSILSLQKEVLQKKITLLEESIKSIEQTITYYKGATMDKKEAAEQLASCQIKIKEYTEEYIKLCEKTFGKEKTAETSL